MNNQAKVINQQPLAHGYSQITLENKHFINALPGHYCLINNDPFYLLAVQGQKADFIMPPTVLISPENSLSLSPLHGDPLPAPNESQTTILVGADQGLSALLFYLKKYRKIFKGIAFIGAKENFPFLPCPSRQLIKGVPPEVIAALPLLEDWRIPNRLACLMPKAGCFLGTARALAEEWMLHSCPSTAQLIVIKEFA